MKRSIMAVFAHPDDETDACGGTLALYAKKGVEITLICATNGSAGKSGRYQVRSPEELGRIREEELKQACQILGIKKIHFLGFSDGKLEKTSEEKIEQQLNYFLSSIKPEILLTWDPDGLTLHPDHIVISRLSTKVGLALQKKQGFPKKIYWKATTTSFLERHELKGMNGERVFGIPDEKITTRINTTAFKETKLKALHAHISQREVLTPSFEQASDLDEESFVLVSPKKLSNNMKQGEEYSPAHHTERDFFYGI